MRRRRALRWQRRARRGRGHLLSLTASARHHDLDSEAHLHDLIRVLPDWTRDRVLKLAPKHRAATRDRLDSKRLLAELGPLIVPASLEVAVG